MKLKSYQNIKILFFITLLPICLYGQKVEKQGERIDTSNPKDSVKLPPDKMPISAFADYITNNSDKSEYEYSEIWQTEQWDTLRKATLLEMQMIMTASDTISLMNVERRFNAFLIAGDKLWQEEMDIKINEPSNTLRITDEVSAEMASFKKNFINFYARSLLNNYLILKKYGSKK